MQLLADKLGQKNKKGCLLLHAEKNRVGRYFFNKFN